MDTLPASDVANRSGNHVLLRDALFFNTGERTRSRKRMKSNISNGAALGPSNLVRILDAKLHAQRQRRDEETTTTSGILWLMRKRKTPDLLADWPPKLIAKDHSAPGLL